MVNEETFSIVEGSILLGLTGTQEPIDVCERKHMMSH